MNKLELMKTANEVRKGIWQREASSRKRILQRSVKWALICRDIRI